MICTAIDVTRLPPEFSRAGRFDGLFFLDLPGDGLKRLIWQQYLQRFDLDPPQPRPECQQWTGAEIKSCCRLAALLDLPLIEAARHILPVATTASETISQLRKWASGRCLDADQPGVYLCPQSGESSRGHLAYDPTQN